MKKTNMNEIPVTETAVASAPTLRRPLIVLTAVLVVLSLLTALFAVFTFVDFSDDDTTGGGTSGTAFDYYTATLADYIAINKGMISGLTIPGFGKGIDEVTPESVKKYINQILLSAVALTDEQLSAPANYRDLVKWSEAIGYGDEVFLYILRAETASGERVAKKYFENAYMEAGHIQIGMGYFGEDFDSKLLGLVPKDTGYFESRTRGEVSADDVILISYTATETVKSTEEGKEDTVKNHKNYTNIRMDLAEITDTAFRDALLAAYGTVGQYFSFEYEEDIDEDGDKETVKYEGVIDAVVENETPYKLTATLPDDFFGAAPKDEELAALNGATLTFYINIDYTVPHEVNTVDTMTKEDFATLNAFLSANNYPSFTPSNDVSKVVNGAEKKGELTTLADKVTALRGEIKKLEDEIETAKGKGDIARLEAEIATLKAEIAALEAAGNNESAEYKAKKDTLETKENALKSKTEDLEKKEASLASKKTELDEKKAALDAALDVARAECLTFFTKEMEESYEESMKLTAGALIYEHLLQNLVFASLPESEVAAMEKTAREAVEYSYSELTAYQKRNYRDINAFAATFFGYDEKDYDDYETYIKEYLAPYEIKALLLLPGIYNTFINDVTKLDAEIDAYIEDVIELTAAEGDPMTREEILENFKTNYGADYQEALRREYAMPRVVYEYLAENNTVDWDMREN